MHASNGNSRGCSVFLSPTSLKITSQLKIPVVFRVKTSLLKWAKINYSLFLRSTFLLGCATGL